MLKIIPAGQAVYHGAGIMTRFAEPLKIEVVEVKKGRTPNGSLATLGMFDAPRLGRCWTNFINLADPE